MKLNRTRRETWRIEREVIGDQLDQNTLYEILKENDGPHLLPNAKKLKGHKHKIAIDGELEIIEWLDISSITN